MRWRSKLTVVELVLVVAIIAAGFVAARSFKDQRDSSDALREVQTRLAAAEARGTDFDVDALELELERLQSAPPREGEFPPRQQMERRVGDIDLLVTTSAAVLGSLVQGEISTTVSNDEIGIGDGEPPPRSYEAIELRLQLDGDAFVLVDLVEQLARQLPDIVIGDIQMQPLDEGPEFRMDVSILLYYA